MARQVAHEIKNPLTPVQLSAEHLLRVNRDRGEPLEAGAAALRGFDSGAGAHPAPDRLRVLELRLLAGGQPGSARPSARPAARSAGAVPSVGLEDRITVTDRHPEDGLPAGGGSTARSSRRALTNVIDNALHAMPEPRDRWTIRAAVEDTPQRSGWRFADTGVGVDRGNAAAGSSSLTSPRKYPAPASAWRSPSATSSCAAAPSA